MDEQVPQHDAADPEHGLDDGEVTAETSTEGVVPLTEDDATRALPTALQGNNPGTGSELSGAVSQLPGVPGAGARGVVMGWCVWLIASWALALSIRSVAGASRLMVYAAWVGLMLVWPTIELSLSPSVQRSDEGTCRGVSVVWVLSQWVSLNAVFQVVAWPMRLYAGWDIDQTIWLTVATAAWSLVVALAVGWGVGARVGRSVRAVLAMVFVVLVFFAEPMVIALLQPTHWPMRIAPWEVLWQLTREPADYAGLGQAPVTILCVGAAGALGWCVLWIAQFAGHGVVSTQATPHAD